MSGEILANVPDLRRFPTLEGGAHALTRANVPTVPTGLGWEMCEGNTQKAF